MNSKKQELKDMATCLFSERGYHLTSVQEIAKKCGMSKSAFYKHFDSKENLLIELVRDSHDAVFQKAHAIQFSNSLTKKQVLQQRISIELDQMKQNSSIFLILLKEFPPSEKNAVSLMMEGFRREMIEWHQQWLKEAFGDQADSFMWDLIAMYEGMVKEYISLIIFQRFSIPTDPLAALLTTSLDAIVNSPETIEPVLTEEVAGRKSSREGRLSLKEKLDQQFLDVEAKLDGLTIPVDMKRKWQSSLGDLKEECQKDHPKVYLVEALTNYLKTEGELKSLIFQVEQTIAELMSKKENEIIEE